jgi:hypothetical protein
MGVMVQQVLRLDGRTAGRTKPAGLIDETRHFGLKGFQPLIDLRRPPMSDPSGSAQIAETLKDILCR